MTREWLGATPPLHPRIKIYAHDDRAVHEFKRADISLSMWGTIVETISRSGPSMIIIDIIGYAIFGFPVQNLESA